MKLSLRTILLLLTILATACDTEGAPTTSMPDSAAHADTVAGADGDVGGPSEADGDVGDPTDSVSDAASDTDTDTASASDTASDTDAVTDTGPEPPLEATGFFHVAQRGGRWWIVTPDGRPFYSVGVNQCHPNGEREQDTNANPYRDRVQALYADNAAWAEEAEIRLRAWGFNTIGSWSAEELFHETMPFTEILYVSGANWETGEVPDYFGEDFETRCRERAQELAAPYKDDPNLIGWFLDNELRWGPDWRSGLTLLDDYLSLPEDAPGRIAAEPYRGDPDGFLQLVADRYFDVAVPALREADPNHMVLGVRSVGVLTPPQVVLAAARHLDIYTVNDYTFVQGVHTIVDAWVAAGNDLMSVEDRLRRFHELSGLPIMVTEFSFRAADSGLPNSWPTIYPTLDTQDERAEAYADYVRDLFTAPWIVGHHWFNYFDQPPGGRFDGENSNFGLVGLDDSPWETLTETMAEVNAEAPHLAVQDLWLAE